MPRKTYKKLSSLADLAVRFIETLTYSAGETGTVKLRPWQREIIESIFAVDEHGQRIVRRVLILAPRKQAKTELIAWVCLVMLLIDQEPWRRRSAAAVTPQQDPGIYTANQTLIGGDETLSHLL
jgi:phage terminase large subunit-like protein